MRKKYKYSYNICNQPDKDLFARQCKALEKHIPGLEKEPLLEDVDGSLYQRYHHKQGDMIVCNHEFVGALYIDSDFDIRPYFKKAS